MGFWTGRILKWLSWLVLCVHHWNYGFRKFSRYVNIYCIPKSPSKEHQPHIVSLKDTLKDNVRLYQGNFIDFQKNSHWVGFSTFTFMILNTCPDLAGVFEQLTLCGWACVNAIFISGLFSLDLSSPRMRENVLNGCQMAIDKVGLSSSDHLKIL